MAARNTSSHTTNSEKSRNRKFPALCGALLSDARVCHATARPRRFFLKNLISMFSFPSRDWCKDCFSSPHRPRNGVWRADLRALPVCLITRHERPERLLLKRKNKMSGVQGRCISNPLNRDNEAQRALTEHSCKSCIFAHILEGKLGSHLIWMPVVYMECCKNEFHKFSFLIHL